MYRDGGTFLTIRDQRTDELFEGTFGPLAREIYLYCTAIRSRNDVERRFAEAGVPEVNAALDEFIRHDLIFAEGKRLLSLALAPSPDHAARRIRKQGLECELSRSQSATRVPAGRSSIGEFACPES